MVESTSHELSEDEAELYDRQIRLWGLECQQRLRQTRVLLVGIPGVGAEIAKNLVLAGIQSLTVIDHNPLSEADLTAQFLAPQEALGKNRASASVERLKVLNPRVIVDIDESDYNTKPDEFFTADYDIVITCGLPLPAMVKIDEVCKAKNIKYFAAEVFGLHGFIFVNLQKHTYLKEVTKFLKEGFKKVFQVEKTVESFPSIKDTFEPDVSDPKVKKQLSKVDATYFLVATLLKFRTQKGRDLLPSSRESDINTCKSILEDLLTKLGFSCEKISPELFQSAFLQANPVCAIIGAAVSQEIIKVVTCSGEPMCNMFFFNPFTNSGIVQCIN